VVQGWRKSLQNLLTVLFINYYYYYYYYYHHHHQGKEVKKDEMDEACARMGETRYAYKIFVGKPEGTRTFGKLKRRLEYNIKVNLKKYDMKVFKQNLVYQ
jgi:hypothetical protein